MSDLIKRFLIELLLLFTITSCTVDYSPDLNADAVQNLLIVNSYLSPQDKISIHFFSTYTDGLNSNYKGETDVTVLLKENDSILYSGTCSDSVLKLDYYPKAGRTYSIVASAEGLSSVSAETIIPVSVTCEAKLDSASYIITLRNFNRISSQNSPVWITANYMKDDNIDDAFSEYITNSSLADYVNKSNEIENVNAVLGSLYCDGFIRIKAANVLLLDSIRFSDDYPLLYTSTRHYTRIRVTLLTASNEYDQYNRTYYQQMSTPAENNINAMLYQPVHVYSNIKNGLGIFAGLNQSFYYITK
jgi:hypothetical protein